MSKWCDDKLCDDKWCDDKWWDYKWCDGKLCDDKWCVDKLCVDKLCVSKWCVMTRGRENDGRRTADGGRRDTEPKTRTPHKDVGNNRFSIEAFIEKNFIRWEILESSISKDESIVNVADVSDEQVVIGQNLFEIDWPNLFTDGDNHQAQGRG